MYRHLTYLNKSSTNKHHQKYSFKVRNQMNCLYGWTSSRSVGCLIIKHQNQHQIIKPTQYTLSFNYHLMYYFAKPETSQKISLATLSKSCQKSDLVFAQWYCKIMNTLKNVRECHHWAILEPLQLIAQVSNYRCKNKPVLNSFPI